MSQLFTSGGQSIGVSASASVLPMNIHTPVFLPGEFHEQRSLVGYNPRVCKELGMTERLHIHFHPVCFFFGLTNLDTEAEAPILWPSDAKN